MKRITRPIVLLSLLLLCFVATSQASAASFDIAQDGRPLTQIVISPKANASVKHSASLLVEKLSAMLGSPVTLTTGDGTSGIALGMVGDFTWAKPFPDTNQPLLTAEQTYSIHTTSQGIQIVGASEVAVEFAVWDLLHQLGYRQFFPNEAWEIIPKLNQGKVSLDLDTVQSPDYFDRRIWYGWGGDSTRKHVWNMRNRMNNHGWRTNFEPTMPDKWKKSLVDNAHMYGAIINANKAAFKAHPEYLGLVKGKRVSSKMCLSNPAVQKIAADYAMSYFDKHPDSVSMSLGQSDGYGWCECDACKAMGSVSTRMIMLANHVAEAIHDRYPNKLLGVLAYADTALPPDVKVNPQVVVSCATQLSGNVPIEKRLAGWHEKTKILGVYDYYAVAQWHATMPGRMKGGNLEYLARTIPEFHNLGAQVMIAESGDTWGPDGLGFYVASRLLWDTSQASHVQDIVNDFLTRSFGPAAKTMGQWYDLMDNSKNKETGGPRPGSMGYFVDRYHRMYALLLTAQRQITGDQAIGRRLDQLMLYTRQVQLWCDYGLAGKDKAAKSLAMERLMRFAAQIEDTGMGHFAGLRGAIPGARQLNYKALPSWVNDSSPAAHRQLTYWQEVTLTLISEVHAQAQQAVKAKGQSSH